jgi:hypothetical protein
MAVLPVSFVKDLAVVSLPSVVPIDHSLFSQVLGAVEEEDEIRRDKLKN